MHERSCFEPAWFGQIFGFQRALPSLAALALTWLAVDTRADFTLLTGQLHGTEPQIAPLHDLCPANRWTRHTYSVIQPLTVSQTGQYRLVSVRNIGAVYVALYQGGFDPNDPLRGRLSSGDFDWDYNVSLNHELVAGEEYQLVVSPMCGERHGLWGVVASV